MNSKLHTSHTDSREFFENELHGKKDIETADIEIPESCFTNFL